MNDSSFQALLIAYLADDLDIAQRDALQSHLEVDSVHRTYFLTCCQAFQRAIAQADEDSDPQELASAIVMQTPIIRKDPEETAFHVERTPAMNLACEAFEQAEHQVRRKRMNLVVAMTVAAVILVILVIQGMALWQGKPLQVESLEDAQVVLHPSESLSSEQDASGKDYLHADATGEFMPAESEAKTQEASQVPGMFRGEAEPTITLDNSAPKFPNAVGSDLILYRNKKPEGTTAPSGGNTVIILE